MSSKAIAIRLNWGCISPKSCNENSEIKIRDDLWGTEWKTKAFVHDKVKAFPGSIKVNIAPYPDLVPATSIKGEKYVRSEANDTEHDNLLKLPRE
jgi:hypothetical protein